MSIFSRTLLAAALLASAGAGSPKAQDEPQTFSAFAVVAASGTIVRAADNELVVVGTLSGPLFIETDEGPVESGRVLCGASVRIDQKSYRTSGGGAWTFTAEDGAAAWGDWQCDGYQLVGCRGMLKLNGGSGRLAGVAGEGAMIWRPNAREMKNQLGGQNLQNVSGILLWRDIKVARRP
jgi:hypothetical protein